MIEPRPIPEAAPPTITIGETPLFLKNPLVLPDGTHVTRITVPAKDHRTEWGTGSSYIIMKEPDRRRGNEGVFIEKPLMNVDPGNTVELNPQKVAGIAFKDQQFITTENPEGVHHISLDQLSLTPPETQPSTSPARLEVSRMPAETPRLQPTALIPTEPSQQPPRPIEGTTTQAGRPVGELSASIVAAKGELGREVRHTNIFGKEAKRTVKTRELPEAAAAMFARRMMREAAYKWDKAEPGTGFLERAGQKITTLTERVWRGTFTELPHYIKEKRHALKLMAATGIEGDFSQSLFEEIDRRARTALQQERRGIVKKGWGFAKDFFNEAVAAEKDLHHKRVQVADQMRRGFETNPTDTTNPLYAARWGDIRARSALAERIGNTLYEETLNRAAGEKRTEAIALAQGSAPRQFINQEILKPIIDNALTRGNGSIDEALESQLHVKLSDYFLSPEFQQWRRSLPPEQQANLDLSLSYATNIVDVAKRELVPNVLAAKDYYQSLEHLDLDIKLTLGTARAGAYGEIPTQAVGERVLKLREKTWKTYQEKAKKSLERTTIFNENTVTQGYRSAMLLAAMQDVTTSAPLLGLATWTATRVGLGGLRAATTVLSNPLGTWATGVLPAAVSSSVMGAVSGIREYAKLNTMATEFDRSRAMGEQWAENAKRAAELTKREYHRVGMADRAAQIQELVQKESLTKEDALLLAGLRADWEARTKLSSLYNINLWKVSGATTAYDLSPQERFDVERTTLDLAAASARVKLEQALTNETLRHEFSTALAVQDTASIENVLDTLSTAQLANLKDGATIRTDHQLALGTLSVDQAHSVVARDRARKKWQVTSAATKGVVVTAASLTLQIGMSEGVGLAQTAWNGIFKGEWAAHGPLSSPLQEAWDVVSRRNTVVGELLRGRPMGGEIGPITPMDTVRIPGIKPLIDVDGHPHPLTINIPHGTHLAADATEKSAYDLVDTKGNVLLDNMHFTRTGQVENIGDIAAQAKDHGIELRDHILRPFEVGGRGGVSGLFDKSVGGMGEEYGTQGPWGWLQDPINQSADVVHKGTATNFAKNLFRGLYENYYDPSQKVSGTFNWDIPGGKVDYGSMHADVVFHDVPKSLFGDHELVKLGQIMDKAMEMHTADSHVFDNVDIGDKDYVYKLAWETGAVGRVATKDEIQFMIDHFGGSTHQVIPHEMEILQHAAGVREGIQGAAREPASFWEPTTIPFASIDYHRPLEVSEVPKPPRSTAVIPATPAGTPEAKKGAAPETPPVAPFVISQGAQGVTIERAQGTPEQHGNLEEAITTYEQRVVAARDHALAHPNDISAREAVSIERRILKNLRTMAQAQTQPTTPPAVTTNSQATTPSVISMPGEVAAVETAPTAEKPFEPIEIVIDDNGNVDLTLSRRNEGRNVEILYNASGFHIDHLPEMLTNDLARADAGEEGFLLTPEQRTLMEQAIPRLQKFRAERQAAVELPVPPPGSTQAETASGKGQEAQALKGFAGTVREATGAKMNDYVARAVAGEPVDSVTQGLPESWVREIRKKVEAKKPEKPFQPIEVIVDDNGNILVKRNVPEKRRKGGRATEAQPVYQPVYSELWGPNAGENRDVAHALQFYRSALDKIQRGQSTPLPEVTNPAELATIIRKLEAVVEAKKGPALPVPPPGSQSAEIPPLEKIPTQRVFSPKEETHEPIAVEVPSGEIPEHETLNIETRVTGAEPGMRVIEEPEEKAPPPSGPIKGRSLMEALRNIKGLPQEDTHPLQEFFSGLGQTTSLGKQRVILERAAETIRTLREKHENDPKLTKKLNALANKINSAYLRVSAPQPAQAGSAEEPRDLSPEDLEAPFPSQTIEQEVVTPASPSTEDSGIETPTPSPEVPLLPSGTTLTQKLESFGANVDGIYIGKFTDLFKQLTPELPVSEQRTILTNVIKTANTMENDFKNQKSAWGKLQPHYAQQLRTTAQKLLDSLPPEQ